MKTMTDEQFQDLPEPDPAQIERAGAKVPMSDPAASQADVEQAALVDAAEEEHRVQASEVIREDLSSADRIHDGELPEDLEQSNIGHREFVEDQADPGRQDTIDSRIRQEEPEPGFDVVPDPDVDETEEGLR